MFLRGRAPISQRSCIIAAAFKVPGVLVWLTGGAQVVNPWVVCLTAPNSSLQWSHPFWVCNHKSRHEHDLNVGPMWPECGSNHQRELFGAMGQPAEGITALPPGTLTKLWLSGTISVRLSLSLLLQPLSLKGNTVIPVSGGRGCNLPDWEPLT